MTGPLHLEDDVMTVRKLCVGRFENNVFVVACRETGRAIVVDAADEADGILDACAGLDVAAIVTTHGHWDHIQAAEAVAAALDAPLMIHPDDAGDLSGTVPIPGEIGVGRLRFEARHLPGHTPGSTCLVGHGLAFTGDTLFPGGPGATAGPEQFATIMESIRKGLFTLPDETLVLPGHGLDTTIGTERPHLDEWERRGF